jgi:DNA-binding XRE family transcriptional regulator
MFLVPRYWYTVHIRWRHKQYNVNSNLDNVPMKAIQLRMARAAVGWGVRELAKKAGVTANTVTRIENGADAKQSTMDRLQHALEAAGVEFTNGDQPGVRVARSLQCILVEPPTR